MLGNTFRFVGIGIFSLCVFWCGCSTKSSPADDATSAAVGGASEKVAVIVPVANDAFTRAVHAGIMQAAEEFELDVEWYFVQPTDTASSPASGSAAMQAASMLQTATEEKARAIVIWHASLTSAADQLKSATDAGIPLVVIGQNVDPEVPTVSQVATDHFYSGKKLAQHISQQLPAAAVILLVCRSDDDASQLRVRGLQHEWDSDSSHSFSVEKLEYVEADSLDSQLAKKLRATPDLAAVVTFDPVATMALLESVDASETSLMAYGYGSWKNIEMALKRDRLHATLVEDPQLIGYSAIMALGTYFRGGESMEFIMPEATLVTDQNLTTDTVQRLLESNRTTR